MKTIKGTDLELLAEELASHWGLRNGVPKDWFSVFEDFVDTNNNHEKEQKRCYRAHSFMLSHYIRNYPEIRGHLYRIKRRTAIYGGKFVVIKPRWRASECSKNSSYGISQNFFWVTNAVITPIIFPFLGSS
jgi:hypothetical protein